MQIDVTDQLEDLNEQLIDVYSQLNGSLTPLMAAIGAVLENSTRDRFRTKTAPDNSDWSALSLNTIKTRGSLLVDRGDLMKSITYHAYQNSVVVGTPEHYGKYHQTGTKYMKARPFLGVSTDDRSEILNQLNLFMEEALNG